jgi:hypothetical protein
MTSSVTEIMPLIGLRGKTWKAKNVLPRGLSCTASSTFHVISWNEHDAGIWWQGGADAVLPPHTSAAHAAAHWIWANKSAAATATISFGGGIPILRSKECHVTYKSESPGSEPGPELNSFTLGNIVSGMLLAPVLAISSLLHTLILIYFNTQVLHRMQISSRQLSNPVCLTGGDGARGYQLYADSDSAGSGHEIFPGCVCWFTPPAAMNET